MVTECCYQKCKSENQVKEVELTIKARQPVGTDTCYRFPVTYLLRRKPVLVQKYFCHFPLTHYGILCLYTENWF